MAREIASFYDAVFDVVQFAARRGIGISAADARAAVIDAYQEIVERYPWSYNKKYTRLNIEAPRETGTVAFSSSTNELTLTGSTWPTDAVDWVVVIDNVTYRVASYSSSTVIVLDSTQAPTADIAAGETYEMYRMYYELPDDFISCVEPMPEQDSEILGIWTVPEEIMARFRYDTASASSRLWTIAPVPDKPTRQALWLYPANSADDTVDVWYRSMPRQLRYSGYETKCNTGTIAVTASAATVTGTGTTFEDPMEGSLFRIGTDTQFQPTGLRGVYPWVEEHTIKTYTSTTALTLKDSVTTTRSGVKYTITDPLDLDSCAIPALFRLAERNVSQTVGGKEVRNDIIRAEQAIITARGASNKSAGRKRIAGAGAQTLRSLETTFEFDDGGAV